MPSAAERRVRAGVAAAGLLLRWLPPAGDNPAVLQVVGPRSGAVLAAWRAGDGEAVWRRADTALRDTLGKLVRADAARRDRRPGAPGRRAALERETAELRAVPLLPGDAARAVRAFGGPRYTDDGRR